MIESFFSPATTPFAVSICLMLMIAAIEVIGALFGMPASAAVDSFLPEMDADLDVDLDLELEGDVAVAPLEIETAGLPDTPNPGPIVQFLGWLCVGRVPTLVLLIIFLTAFGVAGFLLQGFMQRLFGFPLPAFIAALPAVAAALPATRMSGLGLALIMPKEETEAVSQQHFIGRLATITRGEAKRGLPTEAKVRDSYGMTHYVLIEPDDDNEVFAQGEEVVIVRKSSNIYHAIRNTSASLSED